MFLLKHSIKRVTNNYNINMTARQTASLETLGHFDEVHGTRTQQIYEAALFIAPLIKSVEITPVETAAMSTFAYDRSGRMQVTFSGDLEFYAPFVDGIFSNRFRPHAEVVERSGETLKAQHMVGISLAHELGHARRFIVLRRLVGREQAYESYGEWSRLELSTLPLALPSSEAVEYWRHNTGGYRTSLMNSGYTEASFYAKVAENLEAYAALPYEADADDFGLRVIKRVYEEKSPNS